MMPRASDAAAPSASDAATPSHLRERRLWFVYHYAVYFCFTH